MVILISNTVHIFLMYFRYLDVYLRKGLKNCTNECENVMIPTSLDNRNSPIDIFWEFRECATWEINKPVVILIFNTQCMYFQWSILDFSTVTQSIERTWKTVVMNVNIIYHHFFWTTKFYILIALNYLTLKTPWIPLWATWYCLGITL